MSVFALPTIPPHSKQTGSLIATSRSSIQPPNVPSLRLSGLSKPTLPIAIPKANPPGNKGDSDKKSAANLSSSSLYTSSVSSISMISSSLSSEEEHSTSLPTYSQSTYSQSTYSQSTSSSSDPASSDSSPSPPLIAPPFSPDMTQELDPQIYNSAIIKVRHAIHEITAATAASMEKKNRGRKRSLSLPDYLMVDSERMFKYVGYKPKIGWKLNDTAQLAQECGKAALKMKDNNKSLYYNLGLINEGSNSLIYRCVNTQGENYIHKCYCSKFGTDRRRREVNMLLSFAHPCIIRVGGYGHPSPDSEIPDVFCFKALQSDDEGIYISGFTMPEGVPLNVLNSHGILSEIKIAAYLADICNALSYIHSLKVVHLDVKPHNIIVTTTGAKLADFDGCVMAGAGPRWMKKMGVNYTTLYTSPEMLSTKKKITPSHDAWSIGVTLTYLLRHSHPHLGDLTKIEATYSLASLHKLLLSIYRSKVMPDVSNKTYGKKYSNILRRIFVYEPNLRWSCDQIREALRRMF